MSHTLVLAAITAVLKNILENGLVERGITAALGSDTTISALPPDRVATGADEKSQINLFLYQVQWRGLSPSSRNAPNVRNADTAVHGLPQSVEMYYLLTAYGVEDLQSEILLGYSMGLFQETPVFSADMLRTLLKNVSTRGGGHLVSPPHAALADPRLPDSFRRVKVCPQAMQMEEMVNLWSAFQVSYRPSIVYQVTVELADSPPPEPIQ